MELTDLSDTELLDELHDAEGDVVAHGSDLQGRQYAWQRQRAAQTELERRYPPPPEPLTEEVYDPGAP
jgi:hypothetical protein